MGQYDFFLASSLEKVFPEKRPVEAGPCLSAWPGRRASVQLVYYGAFFRDEGWIPEFTVEVSGGPCPAELYRVELIPSDFPSYPEADENYLTTEPGLFPDLLEPMEDGAIRPLNRQYRSIWISWKLPPQTKGGSYSVCVRISGANGSCSVQRSCALTLRVGLCPLAEQSLIHTQWFHADCLAQYYGVEPWSDGHWKTVENFIRFAAEECGVNTLLTPVFTPPLDTEVGGERLTVQLVEIVEEEGNYRFRFDRLEKWARICRTYGIENLEIAHLFTQWGATATPKILAEKDGKLQRIFGWDVPSDSPAYRTFLESFLPALREALAGMGYDSRHVFFHISDEPGHDQLPAYRRARAQAADLLSGCQVVDALSSLEFYRNGMVDCPVVAVDQAAPFLNAGVRKMWVYYCCAQNRQVPNRFFAMPSARNRIMGVLLYWNRVGGFLHWGYNFYNSQLSQRPVDPYRVTHADYGFPSGDAFLVYPGPNGTVRPSLRAWVQTEGWVDMRALQTLESLGSRGAAEAVVRELAEGSELSFTDYPRDANFLLKLREKVWEALEAAYRA